MFGNYQFDLANVLVGSLIGAVLAYLTRLSVLKRLDIKLNKIGIDLGVEGFEPEQPTGVRIGDVSGQVHGDIVGRDKNTSNFFDKLEKSVQNIVAGHTAIRQRRTFSFRWVSTDPVFVGRLKSLSRQGSDNWTQAWIEACTKNTECGCHIREEIQKCRSEGWEPVFIGFDNHGDGIHVNLECEKEFNV